MMMQSAIAAQVFEVTPKSVQPRESSMLHGSSRRPSGVVLTPCCVWGPPVLRCCES